jgi:NTE family protein
MRAIDYVSTPLAPEHVLASAAIPGAFPAVEVRRPRAAAGWYSDGGVRLNAPLAPALALGADRVVVIGLNSSVSPAKRAGRPDAIDGIAQLIQVALSDQLADDVATLAAVNERLAAGDQSASARRIPYIFIAPRDRLEIGRLARAVYERHYAGVRGFIRDRDLALLGRFVNAQRSAVHGELLSYLFLGPEFIADLIALGRRDAERWLAARHDAGLWQIGALGAGKSTTARRARPSRPRAARAGASR